MGKEVRLTFQILQPSLVYSSGFWFFSHSIWGSKSKIELGSYGTALRRSWCNRTLTDFNGFIWAENTVCFSFGRSDQVCLRTLSYISRAGFNGSIAVIFFIFRRVTSFLFSEMVGVQIWHFMSGISTRIYLLFDISLIWAKECRLESIFPNIEKSSRMYYFSSGCVPCTSMAKQKVELFL